MGRNFISLLLCIDINIDININIDVPSFALSHATGWGCLVLGCLTSQGLAAEQGAGCQCGGAKFALTLEQAKIFYPHKVRGKLIWDY